MKSALFLALLVVAGATATGFQPGLSWPDINIPDIIAILPDIIANLPDIISGILPILPDIIASIPDIIASINWPDVIANLPGNLPEIVAIIIDIVRYLIETISNLNIDWPSIIALFPDIDIGALIASLPELIAQLPDLIANLPDIIANLPNIISNLPEIIGNLPGIDWPAIIALLPEIERDPGVPAVIEEFPSLVQLECGFGSVWAQCCTGSILNVGYVLTSARCTSGRVFSPHIRRIRAGTTNRGQGGEVFPISYAINHPSFDGIDGDISLVRVSRFFVYGPTIQRIGISGQGVVYPIGLNVVHAGWGATSQGSIVADYQLHWVELSLVGRDYCRNMHRGGVVDRTVTDNMICVGRPHSLGRKADLRDSGAPVHLLGVLIGVQSYGSYINQSIPVVATFVSPYSDWIVRTAV